MSNNTHILRTTTKKKKKYKEQVQEQQIYMQDEGETQMKQNWYLMTQQTSKKQYKNSKTNIRG